MKLIACAALLLVVCGCGSQDGDRLGPEELEILRGPWPAWQASDFEPQEVYPRWLTPEQQAKLLPLTTRPKTEGRVDQRDERPPRRRPSSGRWRGGVGLALRACHDRQHGDRRRGEDGGGRVGLTGIVFAVPPEVMS